MATLEMPPKRDPDAHRRHQILTDVHHPFRMRDIELDLLPDRPAVSQRVQSERQSNAALRVHADVMRRVSCDAHTSIRSKVGERLAREDPHQHRRTQVSAVASVRIPMVRMQ